MLRPLGMWLQAVRSHAIVPNEWLAEIVTKQDSRAARQRTLSHSISEQMNTVFRT